jgi:antitoxin (DNA-binding transcriptional repressor) of toxin-antitoxin stability system
MQRLTLSRLIEDACRGEDIVIAPGKKPIVRLVPVCNEQGERKPSWLKGKFKLGSEFFEPLPAEELDLWWR